MTSVHRLQYLWRCESAAQYHLMMGIDGRERPLTDHLKAQRCPLEASVLNSVEHPEIALRFDPLADIEKFQGRCR